MINEASPELSDEIIKKYPITIDISCERRSQ